MGVGALYFGRYSIVFLLFFTALIGKKYISLRRSEEIEVENYGKFAAMPWVCLSAILTMAVEYAMQFVKI